MGAESAAPVPRPCPQPNPQALVPDVAFALPTSRRLPGWPSLSNPRPPPETCPPTGSGDMVPDLVPGHVSGPGRVAPIRWPLRGRIPTRDAVSTRVAYPRADGPNTADPIQRGSLPRDDTGEREAEGMLRLLGFRRARYADRRDRHAIRPGLPPLLPAREPLPPLGRYARGESGARDANSKRLVRSTLQPTLRPCRSWVVKAGTAPTSIDGIATCSRRAG